MATTNSSLYAKRLKLYREHGISSKNRNFWSYSQKELGYNYRMNEISASFGISQLKKVNKFVKERNKIADYYKKIFSKNNKFKFQKIPHRILSSYHLFVVLVPNKRDELFKKLRKKNFLCNYIIFPYIDIHIIKKSIITSFQIFQIPKFILKEHYQSQITLV